MITIDHGLKLLRLSERVLSGDLIAAPDLARELVSLGLDVAPVEDLRRALTEEAIKRDNVIVDEIQNLKFPSGQ
jgi:hypothetical protein